MQATGMQTLGETAIPLSRAKLAFNVVGVIAFVIAGALLLVIGGEPIWIRAIGMLGLLFFGFFGIAILRLLARQQAGVVLSAEGIDDRSSGVAVGFIPWSDIQGFGTYRMLTNRFLIVKLVDARKYIGRGNAVQRILHHANTVLCGSPVAISPNGLVIGFDELARLCERYRAAYHSEANQPPAQ